MGGGGGFAWRRPSRLSLTLGTLLRSLRASLSAWALRHHFLKHRRSCQVLPGRVCAASTARQTALCVARKPADTVKPKVFHYFLPCANTLRRRTEHVPSRPQDAHKTPQDVPKTAQDAPGRAHDGSKTPPDAPKAPPGGTQDAPRRTQHAPRRPQEAPKTPEDAPRRSVEP